MRAKVNIERAQKALQELSGASLGAGISVEEFGESASSAMSVGDYLDAAAGMAPEPQGPRYVLKYPGQLNQDALDNIKKSWEKAYGTEAANALLILEEGMDLQCVGAQHKKEPDIYARHPGLRQWLKESPSRPQRRLPDADWAKIKAKFEAMHQPPPVDAAFWHGLAGACGIAAGCAWLNWPLF